MSAHRSLATSALQEGREGWMNHRSLAHEQVWNIGYVVHYGIGIARVHFSTFLHGVDFGVVYFSCHANLSKFE